MSMVFLTTGNCYLGQTTKDKDGNIIKQTSPHFEPTDNGNCVIVGKLDPDTLEQIGDAEVFGNYQASAYLRETLKLLNPSRKIDIPSFKVMIMGALRDNVDICRYCIDPQCRDCILTEWKQEAEQQ